MQETEVKFYVREIKTIEACLQDLEALLIQPRTFEKNIRFDVSERSLSKDKRVLRLRMDDKARLTYKGPSELVRGALTRQEIELIVDDFNQAALLLEALGYEPIFLYEKYRTTYGLNGTKIMLDELPYGNFVEIEGEDNNRIRAAAGELNLNWDRSIPASYHVLFERLVQSQGLLIKGLVFNNFSELQIAPSDLSIDPADE